MLTGRSGCDCSGCDCAVDSCSKSCHGLSCDDIMHMGDDEALFGRYFGHATCNSIEEQYGCDCSGCLRCEEDDRVDLIRAREQAELDECVCVCFGTIMLGNDAERDDHARRLGLKQVLSVPRGILCPRV